MDASRLSDVEFLYTPSQIGLACFQLADPNLVSAFLDWRYQSSPEMYGISRERLDTIVKQIGELIIEHKEEVDLKAVKGIDKRLKMCTNPAKVPGSAL